MSIEFLIYVYCVDDSCNDYRELLEYSSLFILCNVLPIACLISCSNLCFVMYYRAIVYYIARILTFFRFIVYRMKDHIL